jgi:hypothetical protein
MQRLDDQPNQQSTESVAMLAKDEHSNLPSDQLRAHHLSWQKFCEYITRYCGLAFDHNRDEMGWVYEDHRNNPQKMVVPICDEPTFHNGIAVMRNASRSVLTPLYIHAISGRQRTLDDMSTPGTAVPASTEGARDLVETLPSPLMLQEPAKNKDAGNLVDSRPSTLQEPVTLPAGPLTPLLQSHDLGSLPDISASPGDESPVLPRTARCDTDDRLPGNRRDGAPSEMQDDVRGGSEAEESLFKLTGQLLDASLAMKLSAEDIQMPEMPELGADNEADFEECMAEYNTMMAEWRAAQ